MNKAILALVVSAAASSFTLAGTEYTGKEMRQTSVQQQECWYGDTEWNVNLWGTYTFTGTDMDSEGRFFGVNKSDTYLQTDHAWGGGGDVKYFWHKYFGFGVEGFALDAKRTQFDFNGLPVAGGFVLTEKEDNRIIGGVLGTLTLRYPIGCSRFAPYAWGGGGAIFGGGEHDNIVPATTGAGAPTFTTVHSDGEGKAMGQFGGGLEVRITRHIGWTNDFSWNVVDGSHNNFGMVRSGLNFAF